MSASKTEPTSLRVVIIDDQAPIRQALEALLQPEGDIEVVGQAGDGEEGLKVVHKTQPDAILLDLEMPRLDGFAFLRLLMAKRPTPVVVVSSHATRESVFRALELGAMEFVAKPTRVQAAADFAAIRDDLLRKLRLARQLHVSSLAERVKNQSKNLSLTIPPLVAAKQQPAAQVEPLTPLRAPASDDNSRLPARLLCIGASTGGPPAILTLLLTLDTRLPVSILITQHMPEKFTHAFAERLQRTTNWKVREAEPGSVVNSGEVLIASGSHSLRVQRDGPVLRVMAPLTGETRSQGFVPSIDRMLESAAQAMGSCVIAVILTGMSGDGAKGVQTVRAAGGKVIAEAPETAVVASMPEEAIRSGAVDEVVPLRRMPEVITRLVLSRR